MIVEPARIAAGLPLAASLAAALGVRGLRDRRRAALNEALHELRRPLQALALAPRGGEPTALEGSVQLAAVALERLDREINGGGAEPARGPLAVEPLLHAAELRWRHLAERAGASLAVRWRAGRALVEADRCGLAQALDNLIVNAIEHGGAAIRLEASAEEGRLRLAVIDRGRPARRRRPVGRRRHRGHGLRVVRRTAAAHGGEFELRRTALGCEAILTLPLWPEGGA